MAQTCKFAAVSAAVKALDAKTRAAGQELLSKLGAKPPVPAPAAAPAPATSGPRIFPKMLPGDGPPVSLPAFASGQGIVRSQSGDVAPAAAAYAQAGTT